MLCKCTCFIKNVGVPCVIHMVSPHFGDTQGAGYKTISDHLLSFIRIGHMSRSINLARLDEGEGIEATIRKHKAKWHDSCRLSNQSLEYNKTKLQRAENRKRPMDDAVDELKKFTRQSLGDKVDPLKYAFSS
jgi:hypothetical protein